MKLGLLPFLLVVAGAIWWGINHWDEGTADKREYTQMGKGRSTTEGAENTEGKRNHEKHERHEKGFEQPPLLDYGVPGKITKRKRRGRICDLV